VNVVASIPGWTRFPAAEEWIANWRATQAKDQQADFKKFVGERGLQQSDPQVDQLFREFEKWQTKQ